MSTSMPDRRPVVVIGAGGHAKVIISTLLAARVAVSGVYDDNPETWGSTVLGVPVRGSTEEIPDKGHVRAVVAIGSNHTRRTVAERFQHLDWATVIHPAAWVDPSVRLGRGTVVFAGVVINPCADIGSHVIVNTSASIDHDCVVDQYVHLAPGVRLTGSVHVGEGAFLGAGSVVLPGRTIGDWTTVGAGGVVIGDLPSNVTVMGVPARIKK